MKPLRYAMLLGLCCCGCQTPAPEIRTPMVKPAGMSEKDYVLAQLAELGCADGRGTKRPASLRPARRPAPDKERDRAPSFLVPVLLRPPAAAPAQTSGAAISPPTAPSAQPTYVQKIGNTYYAPDGRASWRSGRVMINSDGTTGTLIGNTLISPDR